MYGTSSFKVLKIVAGSAAIGIALAAFIAVPNLAMAAKPFLEYLGDRDRRAWEKEKRNVREAIGRLRKRRLVAIAERKEGTYLVITQKGKEVLKKFEIESLSISKPEEWDHKWRVVLFDIPEKYKRARDALRKKLQLLGFYPLQKSRALRLRKQMLNPFLTA